MNDSVHYADYLEKRHFIYIIIIVLFIHFLFTLLFKKQNFKELIIQPKKEKTIEIKIEDIKNTPDDEPIKLTPTNAQQVGIPIPPKTLTQNIIPQTYTEEQPTQTEEEIIEPEELVEEKNNVPDLPEELVKPETESKILLNEPAKSETPAKIKETKKAVTKKVIKNRYGNMQRQTMPGFFEKMRQASENSGDAMFGDTIFVQGEPGVERDMLQMKLQSYLRKLPWYLTQSFNSQQHDLRKLLNKNKSLKSFKFVVTINKKGEVIKLALTGSTGDSDVDNLMLDIIRSASPFPFIPESLRRERLQLPGTLDPYVMAQGASVIITG